ncbi:hypothetical protein [Gimesia aquarii]|uniref:Uncharacterized protein n=1 Tax=Gimesia aquarii TaxID=2527964 RepID=A0A517VV31_9PLAN|nr:hypothetical protein [Gimesia aquarii]QDT96858.1 hypothetical protein V144x_23270 [Gimesia aquarii]
MEELMIHVEKVVRPLRIPLKQKGLIREELLNHLTEIYEEELQEHDKSELAMKVALERFGPAEIISRHLKESLPWYFMLFSYLPMFAPVRLWPLSTWAIIRRAWLTGMLFWLAVGIPWCGVLIATGRKSIESASALWLILSIFGFVELAMAIGIFGAMHGAYGQRKSMWRTILFAIGGCIGLTAAIALLKYFVTPELSPGVFVISLLMPLCIMAISALPGFAKLIHQDVESTKRADEWNQLIVDE